ncbi:DUF2922 domain-containing protein [Bacillota bacterium LX-D]|nr:DUF2922 domain-containing protein [Bacillota bacterium LX-D]
MAKKLELVFQNAKGSKVTLSLPDPKDGLTPAEVQTAMETIIAKNIFETTGGDLTSIAGARIISTDTTEIIA